jgi:hypothetical protein
MTMMTNFPPKNAEHFFCEKCDYKCFKKSDWERHLITRKHKKDDNNDKKNADIFSCEKCGKKYKFRQGLHTHKKKCPEAETEEAQSQAQAQAEAEAEAEAEVATTTINENVVGLFIKENADFKNLIMEILKNNTELQKQNQDLQKQMLEVCKTGNNTIQSHNNNNNKTFNLQFFLNEQCKDAMNIKDFIDSFQLQLSDLERVGELGYVDGISDIIIKKLNEMDVYKRPIHCSDTKRDIMYVRADNVWEKETNGHDRVRLLVRQVTHKNIKLLPLWTEEYPQAKDIHHSLNDTYIGMVGQAMGGRGDLEENENKIIKRIAKTVYIDKLL